MIEEKKKELGLCHLTDKEIIILAIKESEEIKKQLKSEFDKNDTTKISKVINNELVNTLSKAEAVLLNHIYK